MRIIAVITGLFMILSASAYAADLKAAVSIIPQKYLADKISGGRFETMAVVGKGSNPHNYEPKPQQMVFISKAQVYFSIDLSFEDVWLEKLLSANKNIRHVDCADPIPRFPVPGEIIEDEDGHEEEHDHEHGEEHGHDHEQGEDEHHHDHSGLDPHIWLSPMNMKIMAKLIAGTFSEIDPAGKSVYDKNLAALLREIDGTDAKIRANLKNVPKDAPFMVFHPSWGYFAREYSLRQVAVEVEGKEPKPAQLKRLIGYAKARGIKVVFVQPQFSKKSAQSIASSIGGEVAEIDPLAYEWSSNLIYVSEVMAKVLKK
ncbi:cation ABC transporter substrate-binding protein [Geovibrio thiophilus]|uniref:Cation ABC transporter substrate-binding protein n=1 Tax=Geovibrio thiophilus TaxID=139438 RepID=A0A3R5YXZ3_9BACT|nr:zinc ABC transporter substrate-binding protein [Geovibrio thiophilus]QAR32191.1 cation ABC transporter substrate-binding protein [Geovibrio thiophilus]